MIMVIFEIARSGAEGGLPFLSVIFFTVGRHSEECTLLNTQNPRKAFSQKMLTIFA